MSQLTQRIKKLEEAAPTATRAGVGVAIPQEGETDEQAITRVRASKPCRKVYLVQFVNALAQGEPGVGVADRKC